MKIALVDDHPLLTQTLKNMFVKHPGVTEVRTYNSAALFLSEMEAWKPEIAIIDILMPGINGIQLLERCKGIEPKPKFIVLTSNADIPIVKQSIENGAMGFLSKASLFEEITEAIAEVMDGRQYIAKDLKDMLLKSLLVAEPEINTRLTPREKDVLVRICSGHTLKQIGEELGLSMNTVQYYHKNVMSKLKTKKTADLVVVAIQKGLYIPEPGRRN